jgi:hypothetical protein
LLVVLLAVALLGAAEAKDEGLGYFSVAAAGTMQEKLGAAFTEDGNAAETYYKYIMQDAAIEKEAWFIALDQVVILKPENEEHQQIISTALTQGEADLQAVAAASQMKGYELWGNLFKPDTSKNIYGIDLPSYRNLMKLGQLLIVQGSRKALAGDKDGARENLLAAYRVGAHLQRDPIAMAYIIGNVLEMEAVRALIDLGDKAAGPADLGFLEARRDAFKQIYNTMAGWEREPVERFVKDEDMPLSMRLDCLGMHYHCASSAAKCLYCYYTGAPGWAKDLLQETKFSDPQAQVFLKIMQNELGDKAVCYAVSVLE